MTNLIDGFLKHSEDLKSIKKDTEKRSKDDKERRSKHERRLKKLESETDKTDLKTVQSAILGQTLSGFEDKVQLTIKANKKQIDPVFSVANFNDLSVFHVDASGRVEAKGSINGRYIGTDGHKLDKIEEGANVTNETTVKKAGAVLHNQLENGFVYKDGDDYSGLNFVDGINTKIRITDSNISIDAVIKNFYYTPEKVKAKTRTIKPDDNCKLFVCENKEDIIFSIGNGLPVGFHCEFFQKGAGKVSIKNTLTPDGKKASTSGINTSMVFRVHEGGKSYVSGDLETNS
jgi:hypothetical protein